jgi:hypothetical protein
MTDQVQDAEKRVEAQKRKLAEEQDKLDSVANAKSADERIHQKGEPQAQ